MRSLPRYLLQHVIALTLLILGLLVVFYGYKEFARFFVDRILNN